MMQVLRRRSLLSGVAAAALLGVTRSAWAQTKQKLEGEVLDRDNNPIASVLVRAYRGSGKVGEAATGRDGKYSIQFDRGAPIDTVRYDHTSYNPGVVDDLSGARDQGISKTLYPIGAKLSLFEGQEALSALERVFYIERVDKTTFNRARDQYGSVAKNIQVPNELNERRYSVVKLYVG